jgi:Zn-finger nucleic acid-binding protein
VAFQSQHQSARLICPKDQGTMLHADAGGVWIDRCDCCGGIWFDSGELEKILSDKTAVKQVDVGSALTLRRFAIGPVGVRKCPRDGTVLTTMHHHDQKHIMIDRCANCFGIFLDAGELKDLAEFTLSERVRALLVG